SWKPRPPGIPVQRNSWALRLAYTIPIVSTCWEVEMSKLCSLVFCATVLVIPAFAQSDRGTITGTITDPAAAVIPGAAVHATSTETGAKFETVSTATGNYTLVSLPAGLYDLEVSSAGFSKFVQKGIRIQVAVTVRIDVKLQVSAATDSVTVMADAPLLKTESGEQSHNISFNTILHLPLYGGTGRSGGNGLRSPYAFLTTM